jgi:glycosyltransferase involved in cell wall biosynthesis
LPSLSEGSPNAVLESLAAARAVIGTEVGGVPEMLAGGGGVIVDPGDPVALAEQIEALLADPARARAMGLEGRRAVLERFGVERMVEQTLSLYEELATHPAGPGVSRPGRTHTGSSRS